MDGDLAIRIPAWLIVVALLAQVLARPLLRRMAERWNRGFAQFVDTRIERAWLAIKTPVAHWWENTAPSRQAQPGYVLHLIDRCERHLDRRMVYSPQLDAVRGDKDCGAIGVLHITVNAIRAERKTLASLDATYSFAAALLPLAAWGPIYSAATWITNESSPPMMLAEVTLKVGLLLVALTLGDPARSPRAVRRSLNLLAVGVAMSLLFSSYLDPGWLPLTATIVYKLSMTLGLVAIFAIRRGSADMTAARWTFALAGAAELLAIPATTHEGLVLVALVNVALIVVAYRTVRSSPDFYRRIGSQRREQIGSM